jgi:triacylglycerol lipase
MLLRKAVPVLTLTLAAVLAAPAATAAPPDSAAPTRVATSTGAVGAAGPGTTTVGGAGDDTTTAGTTTAGTAVSAADTAGAPNGVTGSAGTTPTDTAAGTDLRALAGANPVIVVGGISGIAAVYEPLAARLRADGYRVWIYQLPNLGLGDITASAAGLRGYVGQVRAAAGGAKVDLVAHSEGGWTTVRSWQDELVRPVDNAVLADGATNVLIQSRCPLRVVGHLGLLLDGTTYTVVRQALRDVAINPNCRAL